MVKSFTLNRSSKMRSREDVLADLVNLSSELLGLQRELSKYPWDTENSLLIIKKTDFSKILLRSIEGEITFKDLEDWANMIECRDDLGFETFEIQEFIFELSNPEINGIITKQRLQEILKELA